ncbi:MAG: PD-(D/E)XK nuclease family protein [Bacteroidales bacterium]|nr:PD-(D/E)XK nuclease family protein [Bacteroidales bacterium]
MKTFLQECAAYLAEKYPELHRCCLILPSNRSLRTMREELRNTAGSDGRLMPEMYAVANWMELLSGCRLAAEEELLLQLFAIHHEMHPSDPLSFHQFAGNAQMLLNDFNDIDLSLADAGNVFFSLLHIKEIESAFPTVTEDGGSEMQKHYLDFCRELPEYYRRLRERLEANGTAYQGMMYRIAQEKLMGSVDRLPYEKYIFIGFSALSVAEEEMVVSLYQAGKAEVIIDIDISCLQETDRQETPALAGAFIRHLQTRIHPTLFRHDFLHQIEKQLDIYGLPQESSQAELLPAILKGYREKDEGKSCVIVLTKEELLLPVLYALPEEKANISMEYKLKHTPAFPMLHHFMTAIENMERLSPIHARPMLYHRDVRHFFENPIIRERLMISGSAPEFSDSSTLFYDAAALSDMLQRAQQDSDTTEILCHLFFDTRNAHSLQERINVLLTFLQHESMPKPYQELLHHLQTKIPPLFGFVAADSPMDTISGRYLLESLLSRISIPFQSNPESRLQIMGMLETRALDFDHVILLSLNEGVIPNAKKNRTLLPFDLRQHYHLPTFHNHEAIMTYHFYRLLQRAKKISLCYNMDNRNEVREKSRLMLQLQNSWEGLPNIRIRETVVPLPIQPPMETPPIEIVRTESLQQLLENHIYSASSINSYLECPFRFYLKYLLKIAPPEEREENIGAKVMGTVIHKILEERLRPGNDGPVADVDTAELVQTFCNDKVTQTKLNEKEVSHAANRLVLSLCQRYLNDYLKRYRKEMAAQSYRIVQVEEAITGYMLHAGDKAIRFSGVIDREEQLPDGTLRIVDYKTGFMDAKKMKTATMQELTDGTHKEALQLMLYMFVKHKRDRIPRLAGEIISLQHPEQRMPLSIAGKTLFDTVDFQTFEKVLSDLWEVLLNPENKFNPCSGSYCKHCDYSSFCTPEPE